MAKKAEQSNAKAITNYTKLLMTQNATLLRTEVLRRILYPDRDINAACKYPDVITIQDYKDMFEREGIAARVISVMPKESWKLLPEVYETEDSEDTKFEEQWKILVKERLILQYLRRIDIMSGIGQFGVLLLGISDGKELKEPVAGIDLKTGLSTGTNSYQLLYLKPFDESVITIKLREKDATSPRYGMPVMYTIQFEEIEGLSTILQSKDVHWSRIIHAADNREGSDILGVPRMRPVFNRLKDLQKILGGSGEMFWRGGFPGYAFELSPEAAAAGSEMDTDSIKDQMELYSEGLQRYFATTGVVAKSLQPQVADPSGHIEMQIKAIAIALDIPYRVLMGSEQAQLASSQDKRTWNERVKERQESYLTPLLIRPLVDRLIAFGTLPEVEEYFVDWPDLNSTTDEDKARVADIKTTAISKYVAGGCDALIAPKEYLTMFLEMTEEEAEMILESTEGFSSEESEEEEEGEEAPLTVSPSARVLAVEGTV